MNNNKLKYYPFNDYIILFYNTPYKNNNNTESLSLFIIKIERINKK